jgi:putative nucleotidyltransferase with HDIG domain
MISRSDALDLVKKYLKKDNHIKHVLAVEAIMGELAKHFNKNQDLWRAVGLLHDIDYEQTMDDFKNHSKIAAQILKDKLPEEGIHAILAHNSEYTNILPKSNLDYSLITADAASGFIVATALVMPSKKLSEVKIKSLKKKFKDKSFARGTGRERMLLIDKIGLDLNDFFQIALNGMQKIAEDLGL